MKKNFILLLVFLFNVIAVEAQQNIGINTLPNASAALDVATPATGGKKGMLIPRMSSTDRNSITSPATGLMVYDITLNAFYFFNGTIWAPVGSNTSTTGLQLYATSTLTQTTNAYAYSRYSFTFDNVVGGANTSAYTSNSTYTVPTGMGGIYNISLNMIITAYTYTTPPAVYPEIQITSGSTITYYYGVGNGSALLQGNGTNATAPGNTGPPTSFSRGLANAVISLQAGDVVKVFFRLSSNATSITQTVSFSTDGSTNLSIMKLN